MITLRGITVDKPTNDKRIVLLIQKEKGDDYTTLDFPNTLPLNRGQIRVFLGNHFNIPPGEIAWPEHVKVPGE